MILGDVNPNNYDGSNIGAIMTVYEAKSIDQKLDNGHASTGILRGNSGTPREALCRDGSSTYYDLDSPGENCYVAYTVK